MGLFSRTKKVDATVAPAEKTAPLQTDRNLEAILIAPVITEKAVSSQDKRVYAFFITKSATKRLVKEAVAKLYNVTPVSVNIVNKRPHDRLAGARGKKVAVPGVKKAYVTLKAGDIISLA